MIYEPHEQVPICGYINMKMWTAYTPCLFNTEQQISDPQISKKRRKWDNQEEYGNDQKMKKKKKKIIYPVVR